MLLRVRVVVALMVSLSAGGGENLLFGAVSTHEERPPDVAQGRAGSRMRSAAEGEHRTEVRREGEAFTLAPGQGGAMRRSRDGFESRPSPAGPGRNDKAPATRNSTRGPDQGRRSIFTTPARRPRPAAG